MNNIFQFICRLFKSNYSWMFEDCLYLDNKKSLRNIINIVKHDFLCVQLIDNINQNMPFFKPLILNNSNYKYLKNIYDKHKKIHEKRIKKFNRITIYCRNNEEKEILIKYCLDNGIICSEQAMNKFNESKFFTLTNDNIFLDNTLILKSDKYWDNNYFLYLPYFIKKYEKFKKKYTFKLMTVNEKINYIFNKLIKK